MKSPLSPLAIAAAGAALVCVLSLPIALVDDQLETRALEKTLDSAIGTAEHVGEAHGVDLADNVSGATVPDLGRVLDQSSTLRAGSYSEGNTLSGGVVDAKLPVTFGGTAGSRRASRPPRIPQRQLKLMPSGAEAAREAQESPSDRRHVMEANEQNVALSLDRDSWHRRVRVQVLQPRIKSHFEKFMQKGRELQDDFKEAQLLDQEIKRVKKAKGTFGFLRPKSAREIDLQKLHNTNRSLRGQKLQEYDDLQAQLKALESYRATGRAPVRS